MVIFRHGVFKPALRFAEVHHFAFICVELEKPLVRPVLEGFQVALEFVTVLGAVRPMSPGRTMNNEPWAKFDR